MSVYTVSAIAALAAMYGFVTGTALARPSQDRATNPRLYWLVQGLWILIAVGAFGYGISN